MFRSVILLAFLSVFAASADAKDLKIVSYAWTNGNVTAKVTGGMISPEMPLPTTYALVDLTPQFSLMVMPGMGVYPMYMGHQGSVSSATLQGNGYVVGQMVNVSGYYLDLSQPGGFVFVPCSYSWQ